MPISRDVIERIKQHIAASPEASEYCKKAVCYLIDQSRRFTRPVKILFQDDLKRRRELIDGVHDMKSNGKTELNIFVSQQSGCERVRFRPWANAAGGYGIGISINADWGTFEEVEYDPSLIEQVVLPS
jgi:hypothetical protein